MNRGRICRMKMTKSKEQAVMNSGQQSLFSSTESGHYSTQGFATHREPAQRLFWLWILKHPTTSREIKLRVPVATGTINLCCIIRRADIRRNPSTGLIGGGIQTSLTHQVL